MGHYDNCRPGYCGGCGAGPGNLLNGVCPFCKPDKYKVEELKERQLRKEVRRAELNLKQPIAGKTDRR